MSRTYFDYDVRAFGLVDIGRERSANQDEVILCPEHGFYAVSDGMGGLRDGGKTSAMIKQVFPEMVAHMCEELDADPTAEHAARLLSDGAGLVSDSIYETGNEGHAIEYGATLCGVWLTGTSAVFVNIGDSRGYILRKNECALRQVTRDHNLAALLVERGDITREEARGHAASSRITRFVGMPKPAMPETFIEPLEPGDMLLFCSDGLHGMLDDERIAELLIWPGEPGDVCGRLIKAANEAGGRDNISALYIRILPRGDA